MDGRGGGKGKERVVVCVQVCLCGKGTEQAEVENGEAMRGTTDGWNSIL